MRLPFPSCRCSPHFDSDVASVWDYRSSVEQYSAAGGTAERSVAAQVEHLRNWVKNHAPWPRQHFTFKYGNQVYWCDWNAKLGSKYPSSSLLHGCNVTKGCFSLSCAYCSFLKDLTSLKWVKNKELVLKQKTVGLPPPVFSRAFERLPLMMVLFNAPDTLF